MNVYDQAHQLARSLRESEEYKEYTRLKETAYQDSTNKALLDEYKRLQYRMQALVAAGRGGDAAGRTFSGCEDRPGAAVQPGLLRLPVGGIPLSEDAGGHL